MLAFEAPDHAAVDAFHAAALAQGGTDEGLPRRWRRGTDDRLPGLRDGTHYVA